MIGKLFSALRRTLEVLQKGLSRLFHGRQLDDALLDELEHLLYQADLGNVGTRLVEELRVAWRKKQVATTAEVPGFLRERLAQLLEDDRGERRDAQDQRDADEEFVGVVHGAPIGSMGGMVM